MKPVLRHELPYVKGGEVPHSAIVMADKSAGKTADKTGRIDKSIGMGLLR
jgi:hypothetical protein